MDFTFDLVVSYIVFAFEILAWALVFIGVGWSLAFKIFPSLKIWVISSVVVAILMSVMVFAVSYELDANVLDDDFSLFNVLINNSGNSETKSDDTY